MTKAALLGLMILGSLFVGAAAAARRRDGAFSLKRFLQDLPAVPPAYVLSALREGGVRALLRMDVFFLVLFYGLLAVLAGLAVSVVVAHWILR